MLATSVVVETTKSETSRSKGETQQSETKTGLELETYTVATVKVLKVDDYSCTYIVWTPTR